MARPIRATELAQAAAEAPARSPVADQPPPPPSPPGPTPTAAARAPPPPPPPPGVHEESGGGAGAPPAPAAAGGAGGRGGQAPIRPAPPPRPGGGGGGGGGRGAPAGGRSPPPGGGGGRATASARTRTGRTSSTTSSCRSRRRHPPRRSRLGGAFLAGPPPGGGGERSNKRDLRLAFTSGQRGAAREPAASASSVDAARARAGRWCSRRALSGGSRRCGNVGTPWRQEASTSEGWKRSSKSRRPIGWSRAEPVPRGEDLRSRQHRVGERLGPIPPRTGRGAPGAGDRVTSGDPHGSSVHGPDGRLIWASRPANRPAHRRWPRRPPRRHLI